MNHIEFSRKIVIETHQNNTVYAITVFDSYGTEHYIGNLSVDVIDKLKVHNRSIASHAHEIWANEIKPMQSHLYKWLWQKGYLKANPENAGAFELTEKTLKLLKYKFEGTVSE
tara:strand:+ start:135 stop:473 length:339 start_codon:yes stop_codon:yes gene_type:complete